MTNDNTFALQFNKDICTQCGICADSCTFGAIQFNEYPEIDINSCRLCGTCVQVCPATALTMKETPKQTTPTCLTPTHGIWVLAETQDGTLAPVCKELLGKAQELSQKLNQKVEAILVGNNIKHLASELAAYGAQRIHLLESETLETYIEENYARVIADLAEALHPEILLVGATTKGRGLSARLASLLKTGLTADCTELNIDPETRLLHQIRPAFGGNLMATIITPDRRPQMASVRPGIMQAIEADFNKTGEIIQHDISDFVADKRIHRISESKEQSNGISLNDSRIIVSVGRGVKNPETVRQIRQWAQQIGAVVAGSRAAVEAGLIEPQMQIGQTGHVVSPDIYIAIGISGQIQHTSGIGGAKKIIAINSDASAPIFNIADYGWVITAEEAVKRLLTNTI